MEVFCHVMAPSSFGGPDRAAARDARIEQKIQLIADRNPQLERSAGQHALGCTRDNVRNGRHCCAARSVNSPQAVVHALTWTTGCGNLSLI